MHYLDNVHGFIYTVHVLEFIMQLQITTNFLISLIDKFTFLLIESCIFFLSLLRLSSSMVGFADLADLVDPFPLWLDIMSVME